MPLYVFKCEKCDHEVTELRKMDDDEPPDYPESFN